MRGRWSQVLVGAIAGCLCALAIGQWNVRRLRREQEAFQQSLREGVDGNRAETMARLAIASAGQAQAQAATGPTPAPSRPTAPQSGVPLEANKLPSREEMWQGVQVHLRKHHSEPVDTSWAARVTPPLESDLKLALADTKASLGSLSCRSSSCLGTLDWPTLSEARAEVQKMMFAPMRVNCGRSAVLPPDATDEKAPVRMDVLFDCTNWKANGSQIPDSAPRQ